MHAGLQLVSSTGAQANMLRYCREASCGCLHSYHGLCMSPFVCWWARHVDCRSVVSFGADTPACCILALWALLLWHEACVLGLALPGAVSSSSVVELLLVLYIVELNLQPVLQTLFVAVICCLDDTPHLLWVGPSGSLTCFFGGRRMSVGAASHMSVRDCVLCMSYRCPYHMYGTTAPAANILGNFEFPATATTMTTLVMWCVG